MKPIEIELPFPPSLNAYYGYAVRGKGRKAFVVKYVTHAGKAYQKTVLLMLAGRKEEPLTERLVVEILAYPPDRRGRDLDNLMKALLDTIEYAGVFKNDNQIDDLHIIRKKVEKPARVVVRIWTLEGGAP